MGVLPASFVPLWRWLTSSISLWWVWHRWVALGHQSFAVPMGCHGAVVCRGRMTILQGWSAACAFVGKQRPERQWLVRFKFPKQLLTDPRRQLELTDLGSLLATQDSSRKAEDLRGG